MGFCPGLRIGHYQLVRRLGAGANAEVWLAVLTKPHLGFEAGHEVAIKLYPPHAFDDPRGYFRFCREKRVASTVRHAHVVRAYEQDVQRIDGLLCPYIVLEYFSSTTLARELAGVGRCTVEQSFRIVSQLARAVRALNDHGYLHRDVKPDNILIDRREVTVKLADLGSAYPTCDHGGPHGDSYAGTPDYAAPEMFGTSAIDLDWRSDEFSLGVLLFELITGTRPFASGIDRRIYPRTAPAELPASVDASFFVKRLVARMMAVERTDRIQDLDLLCEALQKGDDSRWWLLELGTMAADQIQWPCARTEYWRMIRASEDAGRWKRARSVCCSAYGAWRSAGRSREVWQMLSCASAIERMLGNSSRAELLGARARVMHRTRSRRQQSA